MIVGGKKLMNFKIGFDVPPFIPVYSIHLSYSFNTFSDNPYLSTVYLGFEIKASNLHIAVYVQGTLPLPFNALVKEQSKK